MGLFDKKFCSICGEKIGLLGNRKLEDGNLCKKCASQLSPFFSERRHSTVEDIKAQLKYREENKAAVAALHITRSLGDSTQVLIDEDSRKFVVTHGGNLQATNPDVLDYSIVTGVDIVIDEDCNEEYTTDKDGESVSYQPPRYTYSYDFAVVIRVNHPYFDTIKAELNSSSVYINESPVIEARKPDPETNEEYRRYSEMCREIKDTLMGARQQARDDAQAAAAPPKIARCPYCGANTTPDSSGCCAYCGSPLNE